jgi:RNA polymerase sigma-70 factor (ECF subfamily)
MEIRRRWLASFAAMRALCGRSGTRFSGTIQKRTTCSKTYFLFIHQKSAVFDGSKSSARSWIVQMAYHRAIDRRRYLDSRHFYTQVDLEDVGNELSGSSATAERYENSIEEVLGRVGLRKVFGVLSEIQRQTLGLHLLDGYTFEEIAVKLDQSRGNVKHHYFRGLEKLRKQIFRQGD